MLVKEYTRSLRKNIKTDASVKFVVTYNATKLKLHINTKDCVDKLAHSYIVVLLLNGRNQEMVYTTEYYWHRLITITYN